jgi:AAA ATPase domain
MTTLPQPPTMPAGQGPVRLEDFFERVRAANPFTDNRVNGPSPADVDVGAIHQAAFERLTTLAREAHDERRGLGVVLWGEAGIGKSHLLARLARWAEDDRQACLVYLHNLQASPENLPRSLLKAVVSILTRGRAAQFHRTRLFYLVAAFAFESVGFDTTTRPTWAQLGRTYDALVDRLSLAEPSRAAVVDRTAYGVLFRFFRSAYQAREGADDGLAGLAVRWLSGDYLDPAEARRLVLPPGPSRDGPVALADNQQVKQVLVALTRLTLSRRQPFLLCFDQVDNLDEPQMAALARFVEALIDSSPNLLVVTAGIQASLLRWRTDKVIQDSAWDRLAQFEVLLQRVGAADGRRIVAARLENFLRPFAGLPDVAARRREDPLFPLGEGWYEAALRDRIELRPRDAVSWAREGWRRGQEALRQLGGPEWLARGGRPTVDGEGVAPVAPPSEAVNETIDRKVAQKVDEHRSRRRAEPHTLPPDADNLAGLVHALLEQCRQVSPAYGIVRVERLEQSGPGPRPPYDLALLRRGEDGREVRAGLLFVATDSATSTAGFLRRLVQAEGACERLVLVTDERRPLALGGRGRQYLEYLRQQTGSGFRHVELAFEQYAELDALQAAVGLARSGDLEVELTPGQARAVGEREVIESHHRQGRYRSAPLLRELLATETPAVPAAADNTC